MLTKFYANLLGRFNEINPENLNEEINLKETGEQTHFDENLMGMKSLLFVMKKYKSIISNFKDRGFISDLESIE